MAIRLDQVPLTPQNHLLAPYIPVGELTLLTGREGEGKTWFAGWLSALVTRGQGEPWLPTTARTPRDVVWVTGESAPARLRERLEAQGADLSRVVLVDPLNDDVMRLIAEHRPGLIVLDPLEDVVALHGGRPNELRARLARLVEVARCIDAALIGIRHQTKARTKDVRTSGVGSYALRAFVRSEIVWGRVRRDSENMLLVHAKANDGELGAPQEFTLDAGRMEWLGTSGLTTDDILGPPLPQPGSGAGVIERAMERLRLLLGAQPILADEVYGLCRQFAQRTLREALQRLGGVAQEQRERGRIVSWWWSLPGVEPPAMDEEFEPAPTFAVIQGGGAASGTSLEDGAEVDEDPGVARFRLLELDDSPLPPDPGPADDDPGVERFRRLELD